MLFRSVSQSRYLEYRGPDYFNPIYNDIGYQDVPFWRIGYGWKAGSSSQSMTIAKEPCYNEFRSSYDEVLGSLQSTLTPKASVPLQSIMLEDVGCSILNETTLPSTFTPTILSSACS